MGAGMRACRSSPTRTRDPWHSRDEVATHPSPFEPILTKPASYAPSSRSRHAIQRRVLALQPCVDLRVPLVQRQRAARCEGLLERSVAEREPRTLDARGEELEIRKLQSEPGGSARRIQRAPRARGKGRIAYRRREAAACGSIQHS